MNEARLRLLDTISELEGAIKGTPTNDPVRVIDRLVANSVVKAAYMSPVDRSGRITVDLDLVNEQLDRMIRTGFEPSVVRIPPRSWSDFLRDTTPDTGAAA